MNLTTSATISNCDNFGNCCNLDKTTVELIIHTSKPVYLSNVCKKHAENVSELFSDKYKITWASSKVPYYVRYYYNSHHHSYCDIFARSKD